MRNAVVAVLSLLAAIAWAATPPPHDAPRVSVLRTPNAGIQPQIVQQDGIVHLLYFTGDSSAGDLNYSRSSDYGRTFSPPLRVNSQPGAAMAMGNIRGGQIAAGPHGQVHVAWIGSGIALPRGAKKSAPVLYARLNSAGTAFEPSVSVNQSSWGADGATLTADSANNVYVFWHAQPTAGKGEDDRRGWMAKSTDGGRSFAGEKAVFGENTGVCGCCGSRALAGADGPLYVLFRSATQVVHRDIWLLFSIDHGVTFHGADISQWNVGACVMSSAALLPTPTGVLAAWESEKQVYFGRIASDTHKLGSSLAAPGASPEKANRKYPALALNPQGQILFVWTEQMAWKKGGLAAWQIYDRNLQPQGKTERADGVPAWGVPAALARPDGNFLVMF